MALCALTTILCAGASYAQVQPGCGPLEGLRQHLSQRFGEAPTGHGLTVSGDLLILFSTPDGKTWTIVTVDMTPQGPRACIRAEGEGWEALSDPGPET